VAAPQQKGAGRDTAERGQKQQRLKGRDDGGDSKKRGAAKTERTCITVVGQLADALGVDPGELVRRRGR
jgi:hypothetical protein